MYERRRRKWRRRMYALWEHLPLVIRTLELLVSLLAALNQLFRPHW